MKISKKHLILLPIALFALVGPSAIALTPAEKLEKDLEEVQKSCDLQEPNCTQPYTEATFEGRDFKHLSNYRQLKQMALDLARVWSDTILEGDYVSIGKTQLDRVVTVKRQGKIVLYYITFSERALQIGSGDCSLNEDKERWEGDCTKGRIIESAVVSPDYKYNTQLENDYADFYED
ncbi:MAG: hypothetical protein AB7N80_06120 [Bdellovibrionales bacterium]